MSKRKTIGTYIEPHHIPAGIFESLDSKSYFPPDYFDWSQIEGKVEDLFNALTNRAYWETADIGDLQVVTAKIANAAITEAKIHSLAVTTAKIAAAAITNAKIANLAVDTAKIAGLAVTNAKIANATIEGAKLVDATIDTAKIADAAITTGKIEDLAVTNVKIKSGEIAFEKVDNDFPRAIYQDRNITIIPAEALTGYDTSDCTGSASVAINKSRLKLSTGETNGSKAVCHTNIQLIETTFEPYFKCRAKVNSGQLLEAYICMGKPSVSTKSFGFQFTTPEAGVHKIKAVWSNGSTLYSEELHDYVADYWHTLEAFYDYWSNKIYFYTEGVLRYTATSGLPGDTPLYECYAEIENEAALNQILEIAYWQGGEEWLI